MVKIGHFSSFFAQRRPKKRCSAAISSSGKTMKNLSKIINVRLVNNEKDFPKYTANHLLLIKSDKNYTAIHEIKPVLTLTNQIYVGFIVLELSK